MPSSSWPVVAWCVVLTSACGSNASTTSATSTSSGTGASVAQAVVPVPDGSAVDLTTQLTMADVAILLPLATSAEEADSGYLTASATGDRGVLLPQAAAPALVTVGAGGGPGNGRGATTAGSYATLRVVALRVDPCFAALAPPATGDGCLNQLRLVFQSLSTDGSTAADSAAHAFYALTRDELLALTRSLVALRLEETDGDSFAALGPHAIVAREGLAGTMAAGLRAIVLHYAGAGNLTRVTHFNVAGAADQWTFSGVDVTEVSDTAVGTSAPMVIPTVKGATTQTFHGHANDHAIDGTANPATTSADDLMPLASLASAAALSSSQRQADYDSLLRVENPTRSSPNTIDCVSCHVAMPARKLVAEALYGLSATGDASAFTLTPSFASSADLAATVDATQVNVHAFSYAGTKAAVSQRTVNEAAAVVEYLVANGT